MSFTEQFHQLPIPEWVDQSERATESAVDEALSRTRWTVSDLPTLLSPTATQRLETMAQKARGETLRRFGRVIRLFAPLYLSNECVNNCQYCGFSRDNPILRVTLNDRQIDAEADALAEQGFRNLLLVAGEHPKFVSNGYMEASIARTKARFPAVALEVGPMEEPEYARMVNAGAEGLVVYQETYDPELYRRMHTAGPKKHFDWRLETPERANAAGFRRLGIGALFGIADWRWEALALASHLDYLQRHCWRSQLTVAFPRLRPCAGDFQPLTTAFTDRRLAQTMAAFRMVFPDVGIVLSTREPARLRDGLLHFGVTHMSAGSHTEPGGYTGAGREDLHRTERGRRVDLAPDETGDNATGQFDIADERTPQTVAAAISSAGYEPVWKDWDEAILASV